jgi:site-specific recombinase XerD
MSNLIPVEIGGHLEPATDTPMSGATTDERLVDIWVADQRSLATKKYYRRVGDRLLMFLRMRFKRLNQEDGNVLFLALMDDFKAFEDSLDHDDRLGDGSVATMVAAARSLFRFAERSRHIEFSPAHVFKTRQREVLAANKVLTEDEVVSIIQAAGSDRNKVLLEFLYTSGARARETVDLIWDRVVVIDGNAHVTLKGKGNKVRVIQLPKKITAKLLRLRDADTQPQDPVFQTDRRGLERPYRHMAVETIRDILKEACRRSGITRDISPHWLRHSYGTHADRQGASLVAIQDALGHSDPRTTRRYVQANHGLMLSADFITERD